MPLAAQMEGLKLLLVSVQDGPGLRFVLYSTAQRQNTGVVNPQLRGQAELVITPNAVQLMGSGLNHFRTGQGCCLANLYRRGLATSDSDSQTSVHVASSKP